MFTLKFAKSKNPGDLETVEYVTSAHHYVKHRSSDGVTIELRDQQETIQDELFIFHNAGEYNPNDSQYFDICYIENMQGKTIDTVRKPRVLS